MKNGIVRLLAGLAIVTFSLVWVGCDKLSSIVKAPEAQPVAPAPAPAPADSEVFVSEKGNFKITLPPGFPPFTVTEGDSEDPDDIALSYLSEKHGQDVCMVMVNSKSSWAGMDPKIVLDAGRDGGVNSNAGNTLEREMDFRLNGFPGRRIFIQQKNSGQTYFMRDDFALVKTRLYQIMYVSTNKADLNTPKVLAFFNSFKLLAIPEADVVKESSKTVKKRRLEFTLPSDWTVQNDAPQKDGATTTLMDFAKGSDIRGLYIKSEGVGATKVEALISPFMGGIKDTDDGTAFADFETLESIKTSWGGVRCDCRAKRVSDDALVYWSNAFIVLDGDFYVISVITLDDNTQLYQPEISGFFDGISVQ